jgi:hypothetical protein
VSATSAQGTIRERSGSSRLATSLVIAAVFTTAAIVSSVLTPLIERARPDRFLRDEMVYFPSGTFLDEVSAGQDEILADYLWLRAIQYYGMHRQTDRQYQWAKHIFHVITALNPRFVEAYRFGGLVLAADANDLAGGIDLLKRGFHANQDRWEIPFDLGFLQYLSHQDLLAAAYFRRAAELPGASEQVKRFTAFAYRRGGDETAAQEMWIQMRDTATNPVSREIADYALKDLELQKALGVLQAAADAYRGAENANARSVNDLVRAGLLDEVPNDPFGRGYFIDPASGRALSVFKIVESVSTTLATVQKTILAYRKKTGAFPAALDVLIAEAFMTTIVLPDGVSLAYEPSSGKVAVRASPQLARILATR